MGMDNELSKFFDANGQIVLPADFTLVSLAEANYADLVREGHEHDRAVKFYDFSQAFDGAPREDSLADAHAHIKSVAVRLGQVAEPRTRVAIMAGNLPEYLYGFLGALYANMVPVPLYDPTEPGHEDHLTAVLGDSRPGVVLTNKAASAAVRRRFADLPLADRPRILAIDALPVSLAEQWTMQQPGSASPVDETAILQYTSGSTRTPAGVIISHRSIISNILQLFATGEVVSPFRMVSWLPLHHDMGLILAAFMLILGIPMEMMSPRDFIQQPSRWLKMLDSSEDKSHVITSVPNFALELAVRFAAGPDGKEEQYDFSMIDTIMIGSEPVTPRAVTQFYEKFAPMGLQRPSLRPGTAWRRPRFPCAARTTPRPAPGSPTSTANSSRRARPWRWPKKTRRRTPWSPWGRPRSRSGSSL